MDGIWSLPGPARFARAARTQLGRGNSVLVGLPGVMSEDAVFRAGLRRAIDYHFDDLGGVVPTGTTRDGTEPGDRPIASIVADRFGIDDIQPGPDAAVSLARHETMRGRFLIATVAGKPAEVGQWTDFIQVFLSAARAIPAPDRPQLVVIGSHACASALSCGDPLAVLWWWGVLDRLDTSCYVQGLLDAGPRDDLLRDAITEVAGFDLNLAGYLIAEWDGNGVTLAGALDSFTGPDWPRALVPEAVPHSSTPFGVPPAPVLELWDRGLADGWDAFGVYLHPCVLSADQVRSRVWRAQIRCLMPMIDEERARLEAWLRREVRGVARDEILEPGQLYDLLLLNPALKTWRGGHRRRLIYWLRDARNTLAHMGILTPEEIAHGQRLIKADRKNG